MQEEHIKIGSKDFFMKWLEANDVEKKEPATVLGSLYGMKVIENQYIPKDRAVMVDRNGQVLQVINLKTWKTKKEQS